MSLGIVVKRVKLKKGGYLNLSLNKTYSITMTVAFATQAMKYNITDFEIADMVFNKYIDMLGGAVDEE